MKTKSLFLGTLTLCICFGLFTACGNNQPKNEQPETPAKLDMTAPQVEADESGFLFLDQFPQTDPHLAVVVSEDFTTATISYDGKVIQTVVDDLELASEEAPVHFLDANFDGMTDIYIGLGLSRTANSLLVWDEFEQQFQVVQGSALQNPMLYPKTKSFFDGGSSSYCETDITRSEWNGSMIVMKEELAIVLDPEQYGEIGVERRFTVKDDDDKVLCSTDEIEQLPEIWQTIIATYGFE